MAAAGCLILASEVVAHAGDGNCYSLISLYGLDPRRSRWDRSTRARHALISFAITAKRGLPVRRRQVPRKVLPRAWRPRHPQSHKWRFRVRSLRRLQRRSALWMAVTSSHQRCEPAVPVVELAEWLGEWSGIEAKITIKHKAGALSISGEATWGTSDPRRRVARGCQFRLH